MKTNKEQLAEQFCNREGLSWENDYAKEAFLAGFSAKEDEIKKKIEALEDSKGFKMTGISTTRNFSNQKQQMIYASKVDEVIKILKSLL